jgi:hypothetical protein
MKLCIWCDEPLDNSSHIAMSYPGRNIVQMGKDFMHRECALRSVIGLTGEYGGTETVDPPDLTRRQAAIKACREWEVRQFKELRESALNTETEVGLDSPL